MGYFNLGFHFLLLFYYLDRFFFVISLNTTAEVSQITEYFYRVKGVFSLKPIILSIDFEIYAFGLDCRVLPRLWVYIDKFGMTLYEHFYFAPFYFLALIFYQ